jgi:hypothetical protein
MVKVISIDIETTGSRHSKHKVCAIGMCVGDLDGVVLRKKQWNIVVDWPGDVEPKCWDEFWSKRPHIIDMLKLDARPVADVIAEFCAELNTDHDEADTIFLSDNPSFDFGRLDVLVDEFGDRDPIRYTTRGEYRDILNPADMLEMFADNDGRKEILNKHLKDVKHDHMPANDAEFIYRRYMAALELRQTHLNAAARD